MTNASHPVELPGGRPVLPPRLDPTFRSAALVNRAFRNAVRETGVGVPVRLALEQAGGSVFHFATEVFPETHDRVPSNFPFIERLVKFLLWSRGAGRVYFDGPRSLGDRLRNHFTGTATGRFDADIMGNRINGQPFAVVQTADLPPARANTAPLGRHWEGCRLGFDLGGSDRKVAAVIDGRCVFSEEVAWEPVTQADPQYHFDGIMDSLRRAAAHLPRVDAIGGSAAGVYVNNRPRVASLFRGVPADLFQTRVQNLFSDIQRAWGGVPLELLNDGEVTALAGSMTLQKNGVLGVAMGTSLAVGYVTPEGNITSWLNELAFAPVDYSLAAARDEWSGDIGCGVQHLSQQAVSRLLPAAGIELPKDMPMPERLKEVQRLMAVDDSRARSIYETIGAYLGHAVAHYSDFYDFQHVLVLGRVTSGPGGDILLQRASEVVRLEFPGLAARLKFHTPNEQDKRHGQAVAAASLPMIKPGRAT